MLGNFQGNDQVRGGILNTNVSENSEITAETSRAINSDISSQMSRKLEEMKLVLDLHILDVMNSAIEEKVIPSIKML